MIEYIFQVTIKETVEVVAINESAIEFEKEWNKEFPDKSIMIFILNNPNELSNFSGDVLIYNVSECFKEETLEEIRSKS